MCFRAAKPKPTGRGGCRVALATTPDMATSVDGIGSEFLDIDCRRRSFPCRESRRRPGLEAVPSVAGLEAVSLEVQPWKQSSTR